MVVYVLMGYYLCEPGGSLCGVYSTRELAEEARNKSNIWFDEFDIYPTTIDEQE